MGKIWKINTYTVKEGMMEQHEAVTKKLFMKSKQISPDKQYGYFRQRFHAPKARIMTLGAFNNIGEWETWLSEKHHTDEEFMQIAREWYTTINEDSFRTFFWDKISLD